MILRKRQGKSLYFDPAIFPGVLLYFSSLLLVFSLSCIYLFFFNFVSSDISTSYLVFLFSFCVKNFFYYHECIIVSPCLITEPSRDINQRRKHATLTSTYAESQTYCRHKQLWRFHESYPAGLFLYMYVISFLLAFNFLQRNNSHGIHFIFSRMVLIEVWWIPLLRLPKTQFWASTRTERIRNRGQQTRAKDPNLLT